METTVVMCCVADCESPARHLDKELCAAHLHRLNRYGSPTALPPGAPEPGAPTRRCTKCQTVKPITDFGLNRACRDGRLRRCRNCVEASSKSLRNLQEGEARDRRLKAKRESYVLNKYGQEGLAVYARMEAGEGCDICSERSTRMAIDHDHETGKVRGLLCSPCNTAIGLAKDDPAVLRMLADYVERAK